MKYIAPAAALALAATQAAAGSMAEPEMEPMVETVQEAPAPSSSGWILPLLAIGLIAVLMRNSSDSPAPAPAPAPPPPT